MAPHDPGPFFVRLNYVSGFAPHSMQFSVKNWSPPTGLSPQGLFTIQDGGSNDAEDAMAGLADLLVPFFTNAVTFVNWLLFSKPTPSDLPTPVAGATLTAKVGTATPGFAEQATQMTINYRTTDFNLFKFVFLDYNEDVSFAKISSVPGSGALFDLDAYLKGATNFVTGRDQNFPATFISATKKLNDELRKAYRMS